MRERKERRRRAVVEEQADEERQDSAAAQVSTTTTTTTWVAASMILRSPRAPAEMPPTADRLPQVHVQARVRVLAQVQVRDLALPS